MMAELTKNNVPHIVLNTGENMPLVGLGVCLAGEATASSVEYALRNGYRLIDTAKAYGNESAVGEGIRRSGISRENIFITTKLSVPDMEKGLFEESIEASMERLQIEYIDLYLLHWPVVNQIRDAWRVLET